MERSGYVLAGFETLATIVNNFIKNSKDRYIDNFSRQDISNFLSNTCSGFLHSYGQNFSENKKDHNKSEAELYRKCRETGLFDKSDFITDSGGFQISIGKFDRKVADLLMSMYYGFLEEYHEVLDKAFILDVPPGPGCKIFENFDDVYKLNLESYLRAKNLPEEVRRKIIYIHHFRTPKLWEIYTKILRDNDLFSEFEFHGTGGIVANMTSDTTIPCIIYILPMIPLLNEVKKHNRNYLNFHILGGSSFRDILFYELFKLHIKKIHNINTTITFDSSGLFKGLMIGRYMSFFHDGILRKADLRSDTLNQRFSGSYKIIDVYKSELNRLASKNGFKELDITEIYDGEAGTFFEEIKVYSMFYMLNQFAEIQDLMRNEAKLIYPLYENKEFERFTDEITRITQMLNGGRITKKQKAKSYSVIRSLDTLTNLDEEYCLYLVNKFLSKDEFSDLHGQTNVLQV